LEKTLINILLLICLAQNGSSINKTDRHDIAEILLKVALNTTTLTILRSLTSLGKNIDKYTIVDMFSSKWTSNHFSGFAFAAILL
jgi:hypothetical protein